MSLGSLHRLEATLAWLSVSALGLEAHQSDKFQNVAGGHFGEFCEFWSFPLAQNSEFQSYRDPRHAHGSDG